MITDVTIVYNDEQQIKRLGGAYTLKASPFFTYININSSKGRKPAYTLMSHWAATKAPFAICYEGDKAIKAFYSETGRDVIDDLIHYLNEETESVSGNKR
jgi:hypothetical protein